MGRCPTLAGCGLSSRGRRRGWRRGGSGVALWLGVSAGGVRWLRCPPVLVVLRLVAVARPVLGRGWL